MKLTDRKTLHLFLLCVLLFIMGKQLWASFVFLSKSSKATQDIKLLLKLYPEKDYKLVYSDLQEYKEILKEISFPVYMKECYFFDKYSFYFPLGFVLKNFDTEKPSLEHSVISCNLEVEKKVFLNSHFEILRQSKYFILWHKKQ